jgi:lipoic acid synthetase
MKPRIRFVDNEDARRVAALMHGGLRSVCQSARCPNRSECWSGGTATFMVLGDICTRCCRFCSVQSGRPAAPDAAEPAKLAEAVKALGLRYAVVTSVTRDDLPDYGAGHFASCVRALKTMDAKLKVEALIPDFNCKRSAMAALVDAQPDVVAHNLETVERLTPAVRDRRAGYRKSLDALRMVRELSDKILMKSGIMVGLGETDEEVLRTMADARDAGVELFTIGQYLSPGKDARFLPVKEYVAQEKFAAYERAGHSLGFRHVASGPLVRSSYKAAEAFSKH